MGIFIESRLRKGIEAASTYDHFFFIKRGTVRHLAFRLCLAESNLNLYDFEEEMFVSRTTLEHDLKELRASFTQKRSIY